MLDNNASRVIAHFEERDYRRAYLAEHPYHYIYIGCMDGRASHLPQALGIPIGCAELFQTGGAMFEIGWKYFANLLTESIQFGLDHERTVIILVSSHFSDKHPDHGCRAHNNDRRAGHTYVLNLAKDIQWAVAPYQADIHVLPIEFDTDEDSIILCGESGIVDTSHFLASEHGLEQVLADSFPSYINSPMLNALYSITRHNIEHVRSVRRNVRNHVECVHGESVFLLGRGAGTWLNPDRNTGIILFPEGERLNEYIVTAGKILQGNMVTNDLLMEYGPVIMPCSAYGRRENKRFAIARVQAYTQRIQRLYERDLPGFKNYVMFPSVVDLQTWQLTTLSDMR